ncbi:MAG: hypothetical protein CMB56_002290 [Methanobacteriota archaeon]|nr:MAG: hypothetical protein CMB56_002290 [Euryarchaeota archaeon]|tara:strand:+ start:304 stop:495 length:192 start_codon:yes stop_codon:yes gene_type:complete
MGDGMHKRGSEGLAAPPSLNSNGMNFSWLLKRSRKTTNSFSTPATTSASPSGGGPKGGPPPAS